MEEEGVKQRNGTGGGGDGVGNKGVDEVVRADGSTQDTVTRQSSAAVATEHAAGTLKGGEGGIAKTVVDVAELVDEGGAGGGRGKGGAIDSRLARGK